MKKLTEMDKQEIMSYVARCRKRQEKFQPGSRNHQKESKRIRNAAKQMKKLQRQEAEI